MNNNLYSHFLFSQHPGNTLFHLDDGSLVDYKAVDHKVAQYCHFFDFLGLKQGDRIAQQTEKCIDAMCVYLASLRYGTIYIPLNPAFKEEELSYFIEDSVPALFVCEPSRTNEIKKLAQNNSSLFVESLDEYGDGSIQKKIQCFGHQFPIAYKDKKDIACILYTSGTTGKPKGAMLSHGNLLSNGLALKEYWAFTEKDILLHMLPTFHCHGLFFSCHCVFLSGASMTFLPKLDINLAIKHLPNSTVLMGVPTYYTRLLADSRFTKELTSNMRLFVSGSAPLLEKTFHAFKEKTGKYILERYGMTETGINTSNPLNGNRVPGSVGFPLPAQTLRIVDDQDKELNKNATGHIQVKGDNVFLGYWQKTDKTKESFTNDGFFRTGDIGIKDNVDYIYIIGRSKDMIITGGLNVYPKEIEEVIDKIPGVKESAVIGLPHSDFGEAVTAIVVPTLNTKLDDENVISIVKKTLANYKVPKKIIFSDALPRNTMGKVQKNILRKNSSNLYD